jgi:hypothetical protein
LLIVGVLTILTAGAVVLGLAQAPRTANLTVHNGAGETVNAPSLTAVYSSSSPAETVRVVLRAPDRVTESLLEGGPAGAPVRTITEAGSGAVRRALAPLGGLLAVTGFTARGSAFVATRSASTLVAPDEASQVSGSIQYTATVSGGYLVGLTERYHVTVPGGTESGTDRYQITRIGGQRVPSP